MKTGLCFAVGFALGMVVLACETANLFGETLQIPYGEALDSAAVSESRISDIDREALVIGNGDLGALVWENKGAICLRVTKNDIWDARVDTSKDPPLTTVDIPNLTWSGGEPNPGSWRNHPYPQPHCAAMIVVSAKSRAEDKSRSKAESRLRVKSARLDLRRAAATVELSQGKPLVARVLADRNVVLIETDQEVSLESIKLEELPQAERGEMDGVSWLLMKMPGDLDYPGMEYALALAGQGRYKAVSLVTSFDTRENVRTAAIRLARETAEGDAAGLVARHEELWTEFWSASGVELGDRDFQPWWYRMVYFLRCFAKRGAMPAGLYGCLPNDQPKWHGDYHMNYNMWQPYWTPFIINHPDLAEPYIDYFNKLLPRMQWMAKNVYDCEGACVYLTHFAHEPDPADCRSVNKRQTAGIRWGYTMGMAGMAVQNLWYSHLYRPDRKYLEEKIYPVVREVALYYASVAEKCPRDAQGEARFGPSVSPEHGEFGKENVPFDLAYARFAMKAAITAAGELGRDAELVARLERAMELLPSYPTAKDGSGRPVVVDWTGCKFREIRLHNITVPAVPVFPADQVTWLSPEPEQELFRNTIRQTRHRGCNSTVMLSVAKARFSMLDALEDVRKYYRPLLQPNGIFYWPMHGSYLSESVGISAMVSEFLLQSVDNCIRVFPCWPKDVSAKFTRLRAQGGFLVSAEQQDGQTVKLEITSTVGGRLRLLSPWDGIQMDGKTLNKDSRGIVEMDTVGGKRYVFSRQGE